MKDECAGTPIAEYISLRPKLYSVLRAGKQIIKNSKGLKKYIINKHINFENYNDALFNTHKYTHNEGAQWFSVRVLNSGPSSHGFERHRRHRVVVLEQDTFILA